MTRVSRRDFLNGCAIGIAAGLAPIDLIGRANAVEAPYPPALMGLRGAHPGAFETAHQLGREGKSFPIDALPISESYDLVVVGGGISGLAAAYYYRQKKPAARILILDNHDDFGGHAKRNEFTLGGRKLIGYGGSEAIQSPKTEWSKTAHALLVELGVKYQRFDRYFDQSLYPGLGLARGVFFDRETFGADRLVVGDPFGVTDDDTPSNKRNAKPWEAFIGEFPLSEADRAKLLELFTAKLDYLPGLDEDAKLTLLRKTSYRDYLLRHCGASERVAAYFQNRPSDYFASGVDAISALDLMAAGYPGFAGLGMTANNEAPGNGEPYIYHFPDGNASIARLLVHALIPAVATCHDMNDVVRARFDYARLDEPGSKVRLRLSSTVIHVANRAGGVDIGYVKGGETLRIHARSIVLASWNFIIPHLCPELPDDQKAALSQNVKAPLVYTNIVIRSWESWKRLGIHGVHAPGSFATDIKLDYPVSMGGYRFPTDPSEPMALHLVHVPTAPNQGLSARDQYRAGRARLLEMTFADFETRFRDQLDRMLGAGGFVAERDIAAITVNRWPHGYAYGTNILFDDPDEMNGIKALAKRPVGRIAIANSDAGWDAFAHVAIDEAHRAVEELLRG
jgi:spermidine dehydrogenase